MSAKWCQHMAVVLLLETYCETRWRDMSSKIPNLLILSGFLLRSTLPLDPHESAAFRQACCQAIARTGRGHGHEWYWRDTTVLE